MKKISYCCTLMSIVKWSLNSVFVLCLTLSGNALAFDDKSLWLPASYQKLAVQLRQSALKLEATERCDKVLRGTLHDSSQGLDQAVFLLICRDRARKTFSALADANTLELSYPFAPPEPLIEPADIAQQLQTRMDAMWEPCQTLYQSKTRFMRNLTRLTKEKPVPEVSDDQVLSLNIDFDAETAQGRPLHYRAVCQSADDGAPVEMKIRARQ